MEVQDILVLSLCSSTYTTEPSLHHSSTVYCTPWSYKNHSLFLCIRYCFSIILRTYVSPTVEINRKSSENILHLIEKNTSILFDASPLCLINKKNKQEQGQQIGDSALAGLTKTILLSNQSPIYKLSYQMVPVSNPLILHGNLAHCIPFQQLAKVYGIQTVFVY